MLTQEQQAIVDYVRRGAGDLLITAVAGSGKTFALRKALEVIPQRSILVCAFNRKIVDDWKAYKLTPPKGTVMHVQTFHSIGKEIIYQHYPKLKAERNGTEMIINQANPDGLVYPIRRAATRLLRLYKETEACDGVRVLPDPDELRVLGVTYELFDKLGRGGIDAAIDAAISGYSLSLKPTELPAIDFCDMIWMPVALDLMPRSRYQAIIVDEWQDIGETQWALINKMRAPSIPVPGRLPGLKQQGRVIMAGDDRQSINAWRGASASTIRDSMLSHYKAEAKTLTVSFRCSHAVIKEASALVPNIRACDDAPDGSVSSVGLNDLPRMIFQGYSAEIHTFVLSRSNAKLLDAALYLWREGVRFQLNSGQELLDPLFKLLDTLELSRVDKFRESLLKWHAEMAKRCDEANAVEARERIDEQRDMLMATVRYVEPSGIRRLLKSIIEPGTTGVLLSTVHKVKGLEAPRVFLLRQSFKRHVAPRTWTKADGTETISIKRAPTEEDLNIEYVAITRAKEHLIWVDLTELSPFKVPETPELEQQLMASLTLEALEQEHTTAEGEIQRLSGLGADDARIAEIAAFAERLQAEISARAYRR